MVRSIIFDGKEGYIGSKYNEDDKPVKPRKGDWKYEKRDHDDFFKRIFDEEKYKADMEEYREEMKAYKKLKGKYKVPCSEHMVGRTFSFESDKVNLIFGPNASGKTTVLRGIASHAFCEDGFSKFVHPSDLSVGWGVKANLDDYYNNLKEHVQKMAHTSTVIDWDGSPIYYHNFENHKNYGCIGDLQGSILGDTGEEMMYIMSKGSMSKGQDAFFQSHKLVGLMSKNVTYNNILEDPKKRYGGRGSETDCWKIAYMAQEKYYKEFPMAFSEEGQNTYLFDELDKSMDILNAHLLYTEILPDLMEKYHKQIIVISHSPLVLKDDVYKSEKYNFISMDEEYTEKCRNLLN